MRKIELPPRLEMLRLASQYCHAQYLVYRVLTLEVMKRDPGQVVITYCDKDLVQRCVHLALHKTSTALAASPAVPEYYLLETYWR